MLMLEQRLYNEVFVFSLPTDTLYTSCTSNKICERYDKIITDAGYHQFFLLVILINFYKDLSDYAKDICGGQIVLVGNTELPSSYSILCKYIDV